MASRTTRNIMIFLDFTEELSSPKDLGLLNYIQETCQFDKSAPITFNREGKNLITVFPRNQR
jgi:hypothetical protein